MPITTDGSLSFNGSGETQASGSVFLARDGGDSLVPKLMTDPLAPFGQELALAYRVQSGGQTWDIPLGRYRIKEIPRAQEYFRRFPALGETGSPVQVGWAAELSITDRFDAFDDALDDPNPRSGNTTWQEIQRLSPIPIVQSVPDQRVPGGLSYDGRLNAITQLASNLGGVPHLTRAGALSVRPKDVWLTATDPVLVIDGVIDLADGMSNALYNRVKVTNGNDASILRVAQIDDDANPLAVTRPIGMRTYSYSSPLMDTNAKAAEAARTILARVSTQQSRTAKVTALPHPEIELGDFIEIRDPVSGRSLRGEVSSMSFSMDATASMSIDLIVAGGGTS
ncbi:hypothetical protein NY588_09540 [Curtobacterium flaccumfaciens pv. beticola]|uniref:hypothetical protein n=1 Tax=Curtobacterium flaccumfaciens TaxID=2035 RepID=UPI00349F222D|nr:hypothetical protein [Curtobacterium flaccumfaciens pv. basellae]